MVSKGRVFGGCVCSIVAMGAAAVGLSLMFPVIFAEASLSKNILVDWLMWSRSSDVTQNPLQHSLHVVEGEINSGGGHGMDGCQQQLKVYVYSFPRRFNFGMLNYTQVDLDMPWLDGEVPPPWPSDGFILEKQHNVEYWMMMDLLEDKFGDREVIRVHNPKQADLFFVPFFSSLCFYRFGLSMDPESEDKALQEEMVKLILESPHWKRSGGEDHIIPLHHPNAFRCSQPNSFKLVSGSFLPLKTLSYGHRFGRHLLNASIFIVADFGRTFPQVSSLQKDVVAPYTHIIPTYDDDNPDDPFNSREMLLFFQGTLKRKDYGIVRTKLASIIQNQSGVHFEEGSTNETGLRQATVGMRNSKFCLDPAGDTPSSCRLFDAIVSHCVPVIISDKIELPFEDELDYTTFALFYSVEESLQPGWLLSQLRNVSQVQWLQMWNRLKEVSHHFEYQFPSKQNDAVNMIWKQLHKKVPAIKLKFHRKERQKIADWWNW